MGVSSCYPGAGQQAGAGTQDEELQENLMALTARIYREKMNPAVVDKGQKYDDLVLV
jgi:hypothetical protein